LTVLAVIGALASVIAIIAIVGDIRETGHLLARARRVHLVWVFLLALADHIVRYWRWEVLLKCATKRPVKRTENLLIFLAGSLLIFTPARAGEVAKSLYAQKLFRIPVAASIPVLIAERVGDIAVMATLSGIGFLLMGRTPDLWLAGIILGGSLTFFVIAPILLQRAYDRRNVRRIAESRFGQALAHANESRRTLLSLPVLGSNAGLGATAWVIEVLAYYLSLIAVGAASDVPLFILALAVFPLASIGGALSFLPGGLGATEGGLVGLAVLIGGVSAEAALLAALITRAAILGVVVLAGFVALPFLHHIPTPNQPEDPSIV
jgi:uncharacterized protein (TIRG00374 family)